MNEFVFAPSYRDLSRDYKTRVTTTGVSKDSKKCMYFNARSLRHKMLHLCALVEAVKLDVIGISESWGSDDIM